MPFSFLRKKQRRRQRSWNQSLTIERLEDRQMLASVTFDAGVVTVIGTSGDDLIQLVGSADFQTFTVDVNGDESVFSTFNRADVSSVSVFAGNGDDTVINTLLNDTMISGQGGNCLLYTSPSPRDATLSRMPSSA